MKLSGYEVRELPMKITTENTEIKYYAGRQKRSFLQNNGFSFPYICKFNVWLWNTSKISARPKRLAGEGTP